MNAVDPAITNAAEQAIAITPGVVGVDAVRLRWIGHRIAREASISVDDDLVQAHTIAHNAEHRLLHQVSKLS